MAEVDLLLKTIFLPSLDDDSLAGNETSKAFDGDDDAADVADPVRKFFEHAQFDVLAKGAGIADESWDAPLVKTVTLPAAFTEHSKRRFEKACAVIKKLFANDQEAADEAIEIARQMLADAHAEVLRAAA